MDEYIMFKVDKNIETDWYSFKAGVWHELGGDFLCEPSPESLMRWLKSEGIEGVVVEFK